MHCVMHQDAMFRHDALRGLGGPSEVMPDKQDAVDAL
jgi:hypothetical protein